MKLLHRLRAWHLRRRLIRQRAQNIADLRRGRFLAKEIAISLARAKRLAGVEKIVRPEPQSFAKPVSSGAGRIPQVLAELPRLSRRAA